MIIRMTHPLHGEMHVYLDAEAVENEKNGWVRVAEQDTAAVRSVVPVAAPVATAAPADSPSIPFRRGPGRPPKRDTESAL